MSNDPWRQAEGMSLPDDAQARPVSRSVDDAAKGFQQRQDEAKEASDAVREAKDRFLRNR
jgi:hypothetical protein